MYDEPTLTRRVPRHGVSRWGPGTDKALNHVEHVRPRLGRRTVHPAGAQTGIRPWRLQNRIACRISTAIARGSSDPARPCVRDEPAPILGMADSQPSRRSGRSRAEGSCRVQYGFLVTVVVPGKTASAPGPVDSPKRPDPPRRVAFRRFDLDDPGAEAGEQQPGIFRAFGGCLRLRTGRPACRDRHCPSSRPVHPQPRRPPIWRFFLSKLCPSCPDSNQARHQRRGPTFRSPLDHRMPWRTRRFSC